MSGPVRFQLHLSSIIWILFLLIALLAPILPSCSTTGKESGRSATLRAESDRASLTNGALPESGEGGLPDQEESHNDAPIREIFDTKPMPSGDTPQLRNPVELSYCKEECLKPCRRTDRVEKAGVVTGYLFGQFRSLPEDDNCEKRCYERCR
jgi:hypothetical protein